MDTLVAADAIGPESDYTMPGELTGSGTAAMLDAVGERMIPPTDRWPGARALGLGKSLIIQLRESEWTAVAAALAKLGPTSDFLAQPGPDQDLRIAGLQAAHPNDFRVLQQIIYLGYYAQPAVVAVIRDMGLDINPTPQPQGYQMPPFDAARVPTDGPGSWIPTDRVVRVATPEEVG